MWEKGGDESFREETKSVGKSNVSAERDFGMLDYLMKLKPKATDFAVEGLIIFKANNTSDWRSKLSEEKRERLMEVARKSKKVQIEKYKNTKQQILQERSQKMNEKLQRKKEQRTVTSHFEGKFTQQNRKGRLMEDRNEIREKVKKHCRNWQEKRDAVATDKISQQSAW